MVNIMIGEYAGRLLSKLPVYNNTSVVEFNAWPKNSMTIDQENRREVIRAIRDVGQLQECPFDFYTSFVDGDKTGEDSLFCRIITAGAKTGDLFEILTHL